MWVLLNLEMKQCSLACRCKAGNFPYPASGKNPTPELWSSLWNLLFMADEWHIQEDALFHFRLRLKLFKSFATMRIKLILNEIQEASHTQTLPSLGCLLQDYSLYCATPLSNPLFEPAISFPHFYILSTACMVFSFISQYSFM